MLKIESRRSWRNEMNRRSWNLWNRSERILKIESRRSWRNEMNRRNLNR
jgi:hypothetical protein